MNLIIGIIIGLLISLIVFVSEFFLSKKDTSILKNTEKLAQVILKKEQGAIIYPKTEADDAMEEVIAKNEARGEDTRLSDLNE